MRRVREGVLVVIGMLLCSGSVALSAPVPALMAIDDASPSLDAKDGGGWTGTLALTNLTSDALRVTTRGPRGAGGRCEPALSKAAIGAAQGADAKLTLPATCQGVDREVAFTLIATNGAADRQEIPVNASLVGDKPDWDQLAVFPLAVLVIGLVTLVVLAIVEGLGKRLEYLEATYSPKDSWVSNVTIIAGFVTGLFGSVDVVTAFLGDDAESAVALATVGSAIALMLIGSGPILVAATKRGSEVEEGAQVVTVGGLGLATTVAVAGAFGQLYIGLRASETLDLSGIEDSAEPIFWVAVAILVLYTITTLYGTLIQGTTAPPPARPSELATLTAVLRDALRRSESVPNAEIPKILRYVQDYPSVETGLRTSPGDTPPVRRRRRTAMP